jgi:hypothetical protein
MARKLTPAQRELLADLAGGAEIADALGVTRALVNEWSRRDYLDFPAPVVTLAAGRFYRLSEVLEWHARRGQQ